MTDEEIMDAALEASDITNQHAPSKAYACAFARLIAAKQRDLDAGVAEEIHDKCCVDVKYTDGYDIAAAIRGQK